MTLLNITSETGLQIEITGTDTRGGEGAIYMGGLTQDQIDMLPLTIGPLSTVPGIFVYNLTTKLFNVYQQASGWTVLGGGAQGDVVFTGDAADVLTNSLTVFSVAGDGTRVVSSPITADAIGNLSVPGVLTVQGATVIDDILHVNGASTFIGGIQIGESIVSDYVPPVGSEYFILGSNRNQTVISDGSVTIPFSLTCVGNAGFDNVYVFSGLTTASSQNIKNILETKDITIEATELFSRIPFKKYEYKDKSKHGYGITYGVIAEELKEVMPNSVSANKAFIPNIMQNAILLSPVLNNLIYTVTFLDTDFILDKKIQVGDRIQIFNSKSNEGIIKTISNHYITVEFDHPLETMKTNKVFIYGTYSDCPFVAKDNVFELGMVVLQDLVKTVKEQGEQIMALTKKIKDKRL